MEVGIDNTSEKEAYIIAGFVIVRGHRVTRGEFDVIDIDSLDTEFDNVLMIQDLNWSNSMDGIGVATTFANYEFAPKQKTAERIVFFAPVGVYDILEIRVSFDVVDNCDGIYPIQQCYEFSSVFRWDIHEECASNQEDNVEGNGWCIDFFMREAEMDSETEWKYVPQDQLVAEFDFGTFDTTYMAILPKAPLVYGREDQARAPDRRTIIRSERGAPAR